MGQNDIRTQADQLCCIFALEVVVTIAEQEIDGLIEEDQTPETVEDFLDVVFTAQEELATLKNLQQRIQEALDGN